MAKWPRKNKNILWHGLGTIEFSPEKSLSISSCGKFFRVGSRKFTTRTFCKFLEELISPTNITKHRKVILYGEGIRLLCDFLMRK